MGIRAKVIKASWPFCPAENARRTEVFLPGTLGRGVGYRLNKLRPVRENGPAGRILFFQDDGRPWNICLVLSLFFSPLFLRW
jgi:hypothetical protein